MTLFVLQGGSTVYAVVDTRERAVAIHAELTENLSRYLQWHLIPCELNGALPYDYDDESWRETAFAWGETLITDKEGRKEVTDEWAK